MTHYLFMFKRSQRRGVAIILTMGAAALAAPAIAASAGAAATHQIKLDSTMFAAQVGSTSHGASVYAGALPDPKLGHGAIVFTTTGAKTLKVAFREFFALGSMEGAGSVTVTPRTGGRATLTGWLKINGGSGKYHNVHGKLTAQGTINKAGMIRATLKGSVSY